MKNGEGREIIDLQEHGGNQPSEECDEESRDEPLLHLWCHGFCQNLSEEEANCSDDTLS
jgi:hypothetical protein